MGFDGGFLLAGGPLLGPESSIVVSIIAHETRIEDYLLSDKQSDKEFLWEISLTVSQDISSPSETFSFTITQLDK